MTFEELKLHPDLLEGLDMMGFKKPTPVQQQAIPKIIEGRDLIACAQTGTGKTAAYLLPVLHKLSESGGSKKIDTLIISPTRELAQQIDQQVEGFAYFVPASSIAIYGGSDPIKFAQQKGAIEKGTNIVVGTPGRLIAHLSMKYMDVSELKHLILDEADRMLDMGFYDDIMHIVKQLPKERQTLLFSATMPDDIRKLAEKILVNPDRVDIAISKPAEGILQVAYMAYDNQKVSLIESLLEGKDLPSVLIFTSRKREADEIQRVLQKRGLDARAIHSDLEQEQREETLRLFRNRRFQIMVATDVMARGIDIDGISLVINYAVPRDPEDYVHRIGRTARAEKTGVAITFIGDQDQREFERIEKLLEKEIPKMPPPDELGAGPEYAPHKKRGGKKGHHKGKKHHHKKGRR